MAAAYLASCLEESTLFLVAETVNKIQGFILARKDGGRLFMSLRTGRSRFPLEENAA